jgi:hypothetical protein
MAENQIQKMSSRHQAILNFILANPTCKYSEVAAEFGVTQAWLSTIIHSHAFQDQLRRRHDELFDAAVVQPLGDKLHAAAHMTLDEYMEKVPNLSADQLISSTDKLLGKLGFGTKQNGATVIHGDVIQNNQVNSAHVSPEVLAEARERIGTNQVGAADRQPSLPDPNPAPGTEIEGMAIREEGEPGTD